MSAALPAPDDDHDSRDAAGHGGSGARRREPFIMSMQQVLAALSAIPRMLAFGLLTKEQAAPTIAALKALLSHYQRSAAPGQAAGGKLPLESLVAMLQQQPEMLDLLAPLFDDETLAMLRGLLEEGN